MDPDRSELIAKLFYLLTVAFEDGVGLAAGGQRSAATLERCREIATQLYDRGQQITILCDAVQALLNPSLPEAETLP